MGNDGEEALSDGVGSCECRETSRGDESIDWQHFSFLWRLPCYILYNEV